MYIILLVTLTFVLSKRLKVFFLLTSRVNCANLMKFKLIILLQNCFIEQVLILIVIANLLSLLSRCVPIKKQIFTFLLDYIRFTSIKFQNKFLYSVMRPFMCARRNVKTSFREIILIIFIEARKTHYLIVIMSKFVCKSNKFSNRLARTKKRCNANGKSSINNW